MEKDRALLELPDEYFSREIFPDVQSVVTHPEVFTDKDLMVDPIDNNSFFSSLADITDLPQETKPTSTTAVVGKHDTETKEKLAPPNPLSTATIGTLLQKQSQLTNTRPIAQDTEDMVDVDETKEEAPQPTDTTVAAPTKPLSEMIDDLRRTLDLPMLVNKRPIPQNQKMARVKLNELVNVIAYMQPTDWIHFLQTLVTDRYCMRSYDSGAQVIERLWAKCPLENLVLSKELFINLFNQFSKINVLTYAENIWSAHGQKIELSQPELIDLLKPLFKKEKINTASLPLMILEKISHLTYENLGITKDAMKNKTLPKILLTELMKRIEESPIVRNAP